jgi:PhnB protein
MAPKLWRTPIVVPSLSYEDVPAAVEFLTRAFGFRERAASRLTGNGFVLAWIEVGDNALIALSTPGGHGRQSPRTAGAITQSVKVYVDSIDRHFARARAAGATVISEPSDKFWGGRIYEAKDIEGHYWEFSERDRELDSTEWKLPPGIRLGA